MIKIPLELIAMRPIRVIRQKAGTVLETWSRNRVQKLKTVAQQKQSDSMAADLTAVSFQAQQRKEGIDNQEKQRRLNETMMRKVTQADQAREKARRIEIRHMKGWIGKTIRRIKGK